jgi:hypothetical protein
MTSLLDDEVPGLSARLESMSSNTRQEALVASCLAVADDIPKLPPIARQLVDNLRESGVVSESDSSAALRLAEEFDEEYFRVEASGEDPSGAMRLFSTARLLTAIGKVVQGVSLSDASDALYELCKACEDPAVVARAIEQVIRTKA